MKRFMIGTCAVLLLTGVAIAQTANNPPPPPPQDQQADGPQDDGGWMGWGKHHGRGGHGQMMRGMMSHGKGFHIMVGPGHGLHVNCGDEPIKDCIASSQVLIDALGKLDFKPPMPPAPLAQ
jgi:hypothetical protein